MNYIINKTVLYSSELKRLSLLIDAESYIMLSNPAARLIIEMMNNNQTTLTREYLLKNVWEDYGTTPSNNNLYMAVSEIRKAFKTLGMTEQIISTIPKTGFQFDAELESTQPTEQVPLPHNHAREEKNIHPRHSYILVPLMVAIIATALIISWKTIFNANPLSPVIKKDKLTAEFTLSKCQFYNLGKYNEDDKNWVTEMITTDLTKISLDIDCETTESSVFYQKMPPPVNQIFITNCINDISSGGLSCKILRTEHD